MNICEGKITHVKESVSVNNGTSSQIYHFRINNQQVRYSPTHNVTLSEGDLVKVAGEIKNGLFEAYAIKNETVGVLSDELIYIYYVAFVVSMGVVILILYAFSNPLFGVFPYMVAGLFLLVGFFSLYKGNRKKRAVELLHSN